MDIDMSRAEILGMLSKVTAHGETIWHVNLDGRAVSRRDIAVALALLAVDDQFQVISRRYFPPGPALALLFPDSVMRHGHGRTFAPWVLREVDRLASLLVKNHPGYLDGIRLTLRRSPPAGFRPLPPGFVFTDDQGVAKIAPPVPPMKVDLRASPAGTEGMSWLDVIDTDYRRDRYLSHLPDSALGQRAADIMANLPRAEANYPMHLYWVARLTEIQAEMRVRHGPYPAGWDAIMTDVEWPLSSGPQGKRPPEMELPRPDAPYLVKYGERRYLEPMLRYGKVRISPASRYADPSLNVAIRDDELSAVIDAGSFGIAGFGGLRGVDAALWPGRAKLTKRIESNFYVYCMSTQLLPRLFVDFGFDACLIIRDPDAFIERLHRSMNARFPDHNFVRREVEYYDPLNVGELQVDVLTWKNFRYAYQNEMRLAWIPPTPADQLPAVDLEIGSLEDMADLVALKQEPVEE